MNTATVSRTVQTTTTPQDMLDLWLAGGNVPSVERFHPTPERPIIKVEIGELNGESLYAYGLRERTTNFGTYTGRWNWSLDRDAVLEEANRHIFLDTREAADWWNERIPSEPTPAMLVSCKRITPKVGKPFLVYRVRDNMIGWWFCSASQVCENLHPALLKLFTPYEPGVACTSNTVVPPIIEEVFVTCQHCRAPLTRYGTLRISSQRSEVDRCWFLTRDAAEIERQRVVDWVAYLVECERKESDKAAFLSLALSVLNERDALSNGQAFRIHRASLDPDLVDRFNEVGSDAHDAFCAACENHGTHDLTPFERLQELIAEVEATLKSYEAKVAEEIDRCGLVGRLRNLLDVGIKTCPLCRAPYQRDDEWLRKLLMEGSARAACRCPDRYKVDGNPPAPLPEMTALRDFIRVTESLLDRAVPLERIKVGAATVVEFLVDGDRYKGHYGVFAVDRETLKVVSAKVRSMNVWTQTASLAYAAQIDHLKKRVAEGELLKLNLRYDHNRQTWSERRRVDGVTTVYAVAREHEAGLDGAGPYYCHEFRRPASAQKPDFVLVLVKPYMRVP